MSTPRRFAPQVHQDADDRDLFAWGQLKMERTRNLSVLFRDFPLFRILSSFCLSLLSSGFRNGITITVFTIHRHWLPPFSFYGSEFFN
jgi:hypothetical protein